MMNISPNALLAAQIYTVDHPDLRYMALISVGTNVRNATEGEAFETPQEALTWLQEKIRTCTEWWPQIERSSG